MSKLRVWAPGVHGVGGAPWSGVQYFSTARTGGVSKAPWDSLNLGLHVHDNPSAVQQNRARLQVALPGPVQWLNQVHGTEVWCAPDPEAADPPAAVPPVSILGPCADAVVTRQRGLPLAILTADCLPVVLADADGTVLGVAHAGWRGLVAGVLENTLAAMRRRAPDAHGWRAWLGPAIGPRAFEVGPEVREAFLRLDSQLAPCFMPSVRPGHWLADLAGLASARLQCAGVAHIEASGECTYQQTDRYFSYRRQKQTGRQATVAWLV